MGRLLTNAFDELYNALITTFSLDQMELSDFKQYVFPVISSGAALAIGELSTTGLSLLASQDKTNEILFKFIFGASIFR